MYVLCLHYVVPNPLCRRLSQRAFNLGNQRVNYPRYCQTLTCFRETDCAWRASNALVNVLCRWVMTSIDWQLLRNVIYWITNCISYLKLADPPGFARELNLKQLSVWINVLTTCCPCPVLKFKITIVRCVLTQTGSTCSLTLYLLPARPTASQYPPPPFSDIAFPPSLAYVVSLTPPLDIILHS